MTDQTPTTSWPAHDPATRRSLPATSTPIDQTRVEALLAAEWERFAQQTTASAEHNARASKVLPLGVTSSFQHWDPYPISIVSARGAHVTDVDGRRLLDMSMGFGAMMVGHLNPVVVERIREALDSVGTLFVTPSPTATVIAERFQERFQLDLLRFTQSGTESLMYAIRAARAFTNRKAIVKIEGGYHGGYDPLQVSVKPALADIGPAERISEEPIVTDAIRKAGVALSAVTWEQSVALSELPPQATLPLELYVQGHVYGQLAEEWSITSAEVGGQG